MVCSQVRWEKLAGTLEPGRFCILLKPLGGLNVAADSVFTWISINPSLGQQGTGAVSLMPRQVGDAKA